MINKLPEFLCFASRGLPTVFDQEIDYYSILSQLYGKVNEVVVKNNELEELYNDLKTMVEHYFDTLDVQEEVNKKLEEMAADGSLIELIKQYIDPLYQEYVTLINQRMATQDTHINEISGEFNDRLSEQDMAINVISGRVDQITQLPSGSTSGDAELADIRIAANGKTYSSAGLAVRSQFNAVNSTFNDADIVKEFLVDEDWELRRMIIQDGNISYGSSTVIKLSDYIDISAFRGFKLHYTGYVPANCPIITFFDDEDDYISNSPVTTNTQVIDEVITIPNNATYVRIQANMTGHAFNAHIQYKLASALEFINSKLPKVEYGSEVLVESGIILSDGETISSSVNAMYSNYIYVADRVGCLLEYLLYLRSNFGIFFYDGNKNFISKNGFVTKAIYTKGYCVIPSNAVYMRVQGLPTYNFDIKITEQSYNVDTRYTYGKECLVYHGYKLNSDNTVQTSPTLSLSDFIRVDQVANRQLEVKAKARALSAVHFFNGKFEPISRTGYMSTAIFEGVISIPSNAVYMRIQGDLSEEFYIKSSYELKPYDRLVEGMTQVNDGLMQTAASAVNVAFDKKRGLLGCVYLTSASGYGEQKGLVKLSIFNVAQPTKVKVVTVSSSDGAFEPNIVMSQDGIFRCFYVKSSTDRCYYYKDIDDRLYTASVEHKVTFNNSDLTGSVQDAYVSGRGYSGFTPASSGHGTIFTSRFFNLNNVLYGAVTGANHYPILVTSNNGGASLTPFAIYPKLVTFEFSYLIKNNVIHAVARCDDGIYYSTSADNGSSWTHKLLTGSVDSRPDIYLHDGNINIVYNVNHHTDGIQIRKNRVAIRIYGVSDQGDFNLIDSLISNYGLVYPRVISVNTDRYMVFSDSPLFSEVMNGESSTSQGKDALEHIKL